MKPPPCLTRREFLRTTSLGLATAASSVPFGLARAAQGSAPASASAPERILVVLQLSGGNDGLNTVVPFGDDIYYRERPVIGIRPEAVLKLGAGPWQDYLGFHPSLKPLMGLWEQGQMAVINGVGYPNPNRSHFRALEVWHTAADIGQAEDRGWLGRYLDRVGAGGAPGGAAVNVGLEMPQALKGRVASAAEPPRLDVLPETTGDTRAVSEKLRDLIAESKSVGVAYPDTRFANGLQTIAGLIAGGFGARCYHHDLSGFDTHANQLEAHARLWREVSEGLEAFFEDLGRRGLSERVLVMGLSEFGRRVAENGSNGTDHGAAAPMFLWGARVRGGVYGTPPSLSDLDQGDLKPAVDFRRVYATVLDGWLGADHRMILSRAYPTLPLVG